MTEHENLLKHLDSRNDFKPSDWIDSLEDRKKEEIEFHNFDREKHNQEVVQAQKETDVHANKKFYTISQSSKDWVNAWLEENVRDKVFLDYACGNGDRSIQAAKAGAKLSIGLDISDVSIKNAREAAERAGVSDRCRFIQGDCENTELPGESVDTVLCCGMLHHLDLGMAYPELSRVLKPGGRLLGVEAFGHNPLIQLYRNRTPHMRTEWEAKHILKKSDIERAKEHFNRGVTKYWHLAVLGAVPFRKTPLFGPAVALGNAVDFVLLSIPGIRLMAWQVTFELVKPVK